MDKYKNNSVDMRLVSESLSQYKLFESIKELEDLFIELGLDENDPEVKEFKEILKDTPEYSSKFTEWLRNDEADIEDLTDYLQKEKEENIELDKNIENFVSFRDYQKYIKQKIKEKQKEDTPELVRDDVPKLPTKNNSIQASSEETENNYSDTDQDSRLFDVNEDELQIKKLENGFYCTTDIYKTKDLSESGQGLYIWTEIKYLKGDPTKGNIPLKFGQYGSLGEGKTPLQTIKSYRGPTMDGTVIIYAKRLDEYLESNQNRGFVNALKVEKTVQTKIKENGGFQGKVGKSTEVFGGVSFDKLKEIINNVLYDSAKQKSYPMRDEQKIAHDKMVNYFEKNGEGSEFLLAAKMRFGKNFTLLNVAKTMEMKNVLVLTYKPHVFDSLEQDVKGHVNFDGWKIVDFKKDRNLQTSKDKTTIFMSSAQLALHESSGEIDVSNQQIIVKDLAKNIQKLAGIPFDMVIADEYHYGGSTFRFNSLLKELKYKYMVYVSGTAMKDIAMGRFDDDQIYSWTYLDEQRERKKELKRGYGSHIGMPKMHIHLMDISDEAKSIASFYSEEEGFTMRKMLATENGKLKDEGSMELLLRQIAGEGGHKSLSPYRSVGGLDHTFWVLDKDVKGIKAMGKLMESMPEYKNDYVIIPATGNAVTDIKEVKEIINKAKFEGKRTITLSCYRFKEGVTVPEWDGVFMLDSGRSIEEYLQAIFRSQSPDTQKGKQECHVFDFNPQRCLGMVYEACENMDKTGETKLGETIREFLDYAPILDQRDNKFVKVENAETILDNFRINGSFSEKFANKKNFNIDKIDDEVINALMDIRAIKRGVDIDVNNNDVDLGKNIKSSRKEGDDEYKEPGLKENKNLIKKTAERIATVLSSIPEYLFNSEEEEETVEDILSGKHPELFEEITGASIEDFKLLLDKDLINTVLLNRNIKYFLDAERKFLESGISLEEKDDFFRQHFNLRAESGTTPANLVNEMLDKLPSNIWQDKTKTFCDPVMGTGTFLLGIKERLMEGLKNKIPDENEREKWIVENQIYGYDIDQSKVNIAKKLLVGNKQYTINLEKKDMLKEL